MSTIIIIVLVLAFLFLLRYTINTHTNEKSFLSIINHTFRTPLTNIKWVSDSLKSETSFEKQTEAAQAISISVNRLLEIIDIIGGIKDVKNRSSYDLKAVSMREVIETAIGKYREPLNQKKITFQVPTFIDMPLLTVDTKRISFVIDALLENAIFYTKEGGHITITSNINKHAVTLSIHDDGIGLSWTEKYNLYNRFYRGNLAKKMNTDGTGLSLYLSKIIMERHHGSIKASSGGRDHGSTFSIILPVTR